MSSAYSKPVGMLYDVVFKPVTMWAGPQAHRAIVGSPLITPGATVADLGCGTGLLIELLREKVGPTGRVVGVDPSGPMLDKARTRIEARGWDNVDLVEADAGAYTPPFPVDVAVFSLSLSICPDPVRVLDHVMGYLPEHGSVIVADAMLVPGRRIANAWTRFKAPFVGSSVARARVIKAQALRRLDGVTESVVGGGLYTVIEGKKRASVAV